MAEKRNDLVVSDSPSPSYDRDQENTDVVHDYPPLDQTQKSLWQRLWPAFACGAGLFSDGYLQSVIGPVNTVLRKKYGPIYKNSSAESNVTSIAFAGTVVGQLVFGYTSDAWSRKWSLVISTVILIIFAALSAGAYGANGSPTGLFAALTAYRFLLGIGIGGEYPAGSVGCAEATGELKAGQRNRWFVLFTNTAIDVGFFVGTLIPMIVARITNDYGVIWRVSLGLGVIPPLSLLYLRIKLTEPESYSRENFTRTTTPYWLALKFYGPRLFVVAAIWFIYDFLTYPFSIYSDTWLTVIAPNRNLWQNFGWGSLINFFYIPGAIFGMFTSDWMGPKWALFTFVIAQGVVGFIMTGCYSLLEKPENIAGFVVVYGIFLALGEVGPGDNIGLIASKTCATGIRGRYYAIAAATGKIGGFVGNYIFPYIVASGGDSVLHQGQYPFYVASSLCFLSAGLVLLLPSINQDSIEKEDIRFREYLNAHGYDVTKMGNIEWQDRRQSITHVAPGIEK